MKKYLVGFLISMTTLISLLILAYYSGVELNTWTRGTIILFSSIFVPGRVFRYYKLQDQGLTKGAAFYTTVTMQWTPEAKMMQDFHERGIQKEDYQKEYEKQEFIQRVKKQIKESK